MNVGISRAIFEQILGAVAAAPDEEVCGLLLGREGRIEQAMPAANVCDDKKHRFELDPAALIAAHRAARSGGLEIIGHYHSHPGGRPEPSAIDAEMSRPGQYWLIVADGVAGLFAAVEQGEIHGRFRAAGLVIEGAPLA